MIAQSTLETIGSTPLVKLQKMAPSDSAEIYVKVESFNPTGSYKDRMALAMVEGAEERGDLRPGMTVVEYSGGSTGSALAFVCAVKGYRCKIVSSDAFAQEKLDTMRAFGAELEIVPSDNGKITAELIKEMIRRTEVLDADDRTFFTDQLNNRDIIRGFEKLGSEILQQIDKPIDLFCGAVGTAGMLMGVSKVLRQSEDRTRIIALEPASSPFLSTGKKGAHRVEGIGLGFELPLLDKNCYDEVRGIEEEEGRKTARRMACDEGIFAGTSSGLNMAGALQLARELGEGKTVVTVAVDSGLKYLAGDLYAV